MEDDTMMLLKMSVVLVMDLVGSVELDGSFAHQAADRSHGYNFHFVSSEDYSLLATP